jgi:hypothetical protein
VDREIGGLREVVNSAPMVARFLEVRRQLRGDGRRPVTTAAFLLLTDPLVKTDTERAGHAGIDGVTVQGGW